jgi:hypothetical protein
MRASLALVAVVVLLRSWYLPAAAAAAAALGITIPLIDLVLRLQDLFLHLFGVFHFLLLFVLLLLAFSSSCLRLRLCFRRLALAESDMSRMQGREDGGLSRSQSLVLETGSEGPRVEARPLRMVKQSAGVLLDEMQTVRGQRTPTINAGGASWGGGALALLEIGREHGLEHLGACAKDPFTGKATSGSVHSAPVGQQEENIRALVRWHLDVVN